MNFVLEKQKLNSDFIEGARLNKPEQTFIAMLRGADVNIITPRNGYNAVHWAMHNASIEMMQVLINYNAHTKHFFKQSFAQNLAKKYQNEFDGITNLKKIWEIQSSQINTYHRDSLGRYAIEVINPHLAIKYKNAKGGRQYLEGLKAYFLRAQGLDFIRQERDKFKNIYEHIDGYNAPTYLTPEQVRMGQAFTPDKTKERRHSLIQGPFFTQKHIKEISFC